MPEERSRDKRSNHNLMPVTPLLVMNLNLFGALELGGEWMLIQGKTQRTSELRDPKS
jgi:hypothetical protein